MKVKVYTTSTCPWCKKVKEFLKDNKVDYEEVDAAGEAGSKEMVKRSGQMSVPVIDVGGKIIVGFDEAKLKEALGI